MPDWASDKEKRLAKIQEAMAALEVEAKLAAEDDSSVRAFAVTPRAFGAPRCGCGA